VARTPEPKRLFVALAAVVLLSLAAPGWPALALGAPTAGPRPPGVPPPVDMALLPNPNDLGLIGPRPYDATIGDGPNARRQTGGPSLENRQCVTREQAGAPTVEEIPPGQSRMRLPELRKFGRGAGQLIAVVDTGVNRHPRLAARLVDGGDYVLGQKAFEDCDGHGTIVAGIIAASDDPTTGFTGIAPDARIMSVRQSSEQYQVKIQDERSQQETNQSSGDTTTMARAIVHAVKLRATVINISEAACVPASRTVNGHAPDLQAAVHHAARNNVVVVAAAGNIGQICPQNKDDDVGAVASPAWFDDDVLTVAAIDSTTSQAAEFSLHGPWVDVAAPGTDITSLDPASNQLANQTIQDNNVGPIVGTSFATPYVAGLAALIRERYPDLNAYQVMARIEKTTQQAAGKNGWNNQIGHGVIDPIAALTAVIPEEHGSTPPPVAAAQLENLIPPPQKDPLPTKVALIGSAAALALLGLTALIVFTVATSRKP
jgi:membrane-anchored mycosin MYCP